MRKNLVIATAIITQAIILQPFIANNAMAFGFGSSKKVAPLRAGMSPEIKMPGEVATPPATPNSENSAENLGPPATKQQREEALKLDIVSQARFWVTEFAKNQKDEEIAFLAASSLEKIGSYDKSVEVAAIGIQSNENSGRLWKCLGSSLLKRNQAQEAINALNKANTIMPRDAETYGLLGIAFDNIGNFDAAQRAYNNAHSIDPNNPIYPSNQGFSLIMAGKFAQAENILRYAINLPNAPIQARQNLALAIGMQGRLNESEQVAIADLPADLAQSNVDYLRKMLDGQQRWKNDKVSQK